MAGEWAASMAADVAGTWASSLAVYVAGKWTSLMDVYSDCGEGCVRGVGCVDSNG